MSVSASRYLKYGKIIAGVVILIPVILVFFLYVSSVDKEVTAGSAYGFTIGQSKADAYRIAQSQFRSGDITAIDTIRNREEEVKRFPEINGNASYRTVAAIEGWFDNWNHWSLWIDGDNPSLLVIFTFNGDRFSGVGRGPLGEVWQPADADGITFRVGQSYAEVYKLLEALSRSPGYETLVLDTGWMARRQPVELNEAEYRYVAEYDDWTLLVSRSRLNSIQLTFDQGRLSRVHRHRQYFELP